MNAENIFELFLSSAWSDAVFWFGGLVAITAFIRKVSKDAEDDLDPEKRQVLGLQLLKIEYRNTISWIPNLYVCLNL